VSPPLRIISDTHAFDRSHAAWSVRNLFSVSVCTNF